MIEMMSCVVKERLIHCGGYSLYLDMLTYVTQHINIWEGDVLCIEDTARLWEDGKAIVESGPTSAPLGPVVTVQVQEHVWSTMCISAKVVADASEFIDFGTTRTVGTLAYRLGDCSQKFCTLGCIDGSRP